MPLAISNIAYAGKHIDFLRTVSNAGVTGVEVAPTRIQPWDKLNEASVRSYRNLCESFGLEVTSFQAFFFGKPHLQLLGDRQNFLLMCDHFRLVLNLAAEAGAKVLVFGAPKNRLLLGLDPLSLSNVILDRISSLGELASEHGLIVGVEPAPKHYGGEVLCSYKDVLRLVKAVDLDSVQVHLDTACVHLNSDSISDAVYESSSYLCHFHVSQPDLQQFNAPMESHKDAALALAKVSYAKWRCIEMRESAGGLRDIETAIAFAMSIYL